MASSNKLVKKENIIAAVRSEEQATALSKLEITVLQLDLTNENAVVESILRHNGKSHSKIQLGSNKLQMTAFIDNLVVGIVIHTASSLNTDIALHLVTALAKQKEVSKQETYMIHVSEVCDMFKC